MFKKANKLTARLRLAFIGPAGTGKTFSALSIAVGLGGKVAVVDTEHGAASKFADSFDFDVCELKNFHPQGYIDAIHAAEQAGYAVVILDSLSHAWTGKGSALELHDQATAKTRNSFTAWAAVTPLQNQLIDAILASTCHVIGTMRAKTDYVQQKDERGKTTVEKVGLGAVQRDGIEYEFDVVGTLDQEHRLFISKTRCPALDNKVIERPGDAFAKTLLAWLGNGPLPAPTKEATPAPTSQPENGNGRTAVKSNLPATGAELISRINKFDAKLAKEGLFAAGTLTRAVLEYGKDVHWPADPEKWNASQILQASTWVKEFEAKCRKDRDAELINDRQHDTIHQLLQATGYDPQVFCDRFKITDTTFLPANRLDEAVALLNEVKAGAKNPAR